MTTWYVDPEGGVDTNDGKSFATRKRTLSSASAGFAAGDSMRIIASPAPNSLGSATWTDNSGTVTLAAAQTFTVDDCETAWTAAGTGITSTSNTTERKQGTACVAITAAATFTGGLIAYKAVSNLNLSAYSCISLWMYASANLANNIKVALCSDSAGQTPIVTLSMPAWLVGVTSPSKPWPVLYENGGAALPSGVNSIAIYATANPFATTGTFYLDNVIATTPWGSTGHLSHACLIGKNDVAEPEWYPIMSIDGTTVVLGSTADFGAAAPVKNYRGTTESVTTYALYPLRTRTTATSTFSGVAGTPSAPNMLTGGWDRTAMASQTGQSWLTGECFQGTGIAVTGNWSWLPDSSIGLAAYGTGVTFSWSGGMLHILGTTSCGVAVIRSSVSLLTDLDLGNIVWNYSNVQFFALANRTKIRIRRMTGIPTSAIVITDTSLDEGIDIAIGSLDNNNSGLAISSECATRVRGVTFKNNSVASVVPGGSSFGSTLILDRPVLGDTTLISGGLSWTGGSSVRINAANGVRWDNRVYTYEATQQMVQTPVHGTTAQSLSITANDYTALVNFPFCARIARVACFAGKTITFSTYMQRTSQGINAGLLTRSGSVAGVGDATTQGAAPNNTWEATTITFTPTEDGVVDIFAYIVAATLNTSTNGAIAYFGDTSVTST